MVQIKVYYIYLRNRIQASRQRGRVVKATDSNIQNSSYLFRSRAQVQILSLSDLFALRAFFLF